MGSSGSSAWLLAAGVLAGCGGTDSTPSAAPSSPTPTPTPSGRRLPAEPGTVPPPRLGTRELPTQANGFGEVQRTPPELRERRFSLADTVEPPGVGGPSILGRDRVRPGMILEGGPVVRAFDEIGWSWGGWYRTLLDLHRVSLTGG